MLSCRCPFCPRCMPARPQAMWNTWACALSRRAPRCWRRCWRRGSPCLTNRSSASSWSWTGSRRCRVAARQTLCSCPAPARRARVGAASGWQGVWPTGWVDVWACGHERTEGLASPLCDWLERVASHAVVGTDQPDLPCPALPFPALRLSCLPGPRPPPFSLPGLLPHLTAPCRP